MAAAAAAAGSSGFGIDTAHAAADVLNLATQGHQEINFFLQNGCSYLDSCCDVERSKQLAKLPAWVRAKEDRMRTGLAFTSTIATLILAQVTAGSGRPSRCNLFSIRGGEAEQEDRALVLRSAIYAARCPSVRAFVTCLLRAHPAWCHRFTEAVTAVFNADSKHPEQLEASAIERLVKAHSLRDGCPLFAERSQLEKAAASAAAGGADDPEEEQAAEDSSDASSSAGGNAEDDADDDDSSYEDGGGIDEDEAAGASASASFASTADAAAAAAAAARKAESFAAKAAAAAKAATAAAAQARAAATAAAAAMPASAGASSVAMAASPASVSSAAGRAAAIAARMTGLDDHDPLPPLVSQGAASGSASSATAMIAASVSSAAAMTDSACISGDAPLVGGKRRKATATDDSQAEAAAAGASCDRSKRGRRQDSEG